MIDFLELFQQKGLDIASVAAIISLTEVIKSVCQLNSRYVPLIPLCLGFIFGGVTVLLDQQGLFEWHRVVLRVLIDGLIYAGVASFMYKMYRTTVRNK